MRKIKIRNSGGWPGEVHRCMVWFVKSASYKGKGQGYAESSMAYGDQPERNSLKEAMDDLVVLRATSMRGNRPDGVFYANVITYPAGHPPKQMSREMILEMGGEE